jgi:hypothetical protein
MDGQITDLPLDRPASLAYHLSLRSDWVRRSELAYLYYPDANESLVDNVVYGLGLISKHNRWDVLQKVLIPVQNVFEDFSLYKSGFNILHSFEDALEKHVPSDARIPGQIKAVLSHFT